MGRSSANTTSSTRTFQSSKAPIEEPPKAPRKKPSIKLPKIKLSPWLLVGLLIIFSIFMVMQYHQAKKNIQKNTPVAVKHQVDDVVSRVGKLIILPKGEKPSTVATVSNADKLKDQAFFANAKDGDKVLVYNKQKQAILYRPSTNQLVNVSTVTVSPTGETSATPN